MSLSVSCDTRRIYPTGGGHRRPAPVPELAREAVVDRVVEDVLERGLVLLLGLDLFRPEALAEDVVLAAVALVEGAGVLAVQVAHAVGEVRERRFDHEVVVIAEQAPGVESPAIAAADPPQDLEEDAAVVVVHEDRRVVVPFGADVVVRAGREIAVRTSHRSERSSASRGTDAAYAIRRTAVTDSSRARHETPLRGTCRGGHGRNGLV